MIDITTWLEETKNAIGTFGILQNYWYIFVLVAVCGSIFAASFLSFIDCFDYRMYIFKYSILCIFLIMTMMLEYRIYGVVFDILEQETPHTTFVQLVEESYDIQELKSEEIDFEEYKYMPDDGSYQVSYKIDGKKSTGKLFIKENKVGIIDDKGKLIEIHE